MKGLHFNKAIVNRYKNELSSEEKERLNTEFGEVILDMGYKN